MASEGEARPWRGGSGRGGGGGGREGAEGIEDDVRGADEGDIFIPPSWSLMSPIQKGGKTHLIRSRQ